MKARNFFQRAMLSLAILACFGFQTAMNAQGAQCLAPVDATSDMPANPEDRANAVFSFDYKIVSNVKHRSREGKITEINRLKYYVNSQDGTMFFPKDAVPSSVLRALTGYSSMEDEDVEFNGMVIFPNGKYVMFVRLKEFEEGNPKRALTKSVPSNADDIVVENFTNITKFFNDIADKFASQDDLEPLPSNSKWQGKSLGYTAEISGRYTNHAVRTMYIDLQPTAITTGTGMVGFLVGVVKDWRIENCNRLVVFHKVEHDDGSYIQAELVSMTQERKTFNGSSYEPTQLASFSAVPGAVDEEMLNNFQEKMAEYQSQLIELSTRLEKLKGEKRRCLNTHRDNPEYCNAHFDPQIERAENELKALNEKLMESMGVRNR